VTQEGRIIESNLTLNETIPPQFSSETEAALAQGVNAVMTSVEIFILILAILG
jgi:hypothetical protein